MVPIHLGAARSTFVIVSGHPVACAQFRSGKVGNLLKVFQRSCLRGERGESEYDSSITVIIYYVGMEKHSVVVGFIGNVGMPKLGEYIHHRMRKTSGRFLRPGRPLTQFTARMGVTINRLARGKSDVLLCPRPFHLPHTPSYHGYSSIETPDLVH